MRDLTKREISIAVRALEDAMDTHAETEVLDLDWTHERIDSWVRDMDQCGVFEGIETDDHESDVYLQVLDKAP